LFCSRKKYIFYLSSFLGISLKRFAK
jgi:hypothetical protein